MDWGESPDYVLSMPLWLDVLLRAAPVIAGALVLAGVLLTVRQKDHNDRKDQWWKRVEWAAAAVSSPSGHRRTIGLAALICLIEQRDRINPTDAQLLQAIIDAALLEGGSADAIRGMEQSVRTIEDEELDDG